MSSIKTNFEMPRGTDPTKQAQRLAQDLSSNFKAINNLFGGLNIQSLILPVGTVVHSMLTVEQFQLEASDAWILSNGQTCAGSKYAAITGFTTVPDMTGRFLRGKGANNPDGDRPLGEYHADKVISHNHTGGANDAYGYDVLPSKGATVGAGTGYYGGNETAPKSITVNIFIKIN
jgi:hypothetical protein